MPASSTSVCRWLCLFVSVVTSISAPRAEPMQTMREPAAFVRALYEREIAQNAARQPGSEAEFSGLFTREVRQLIHAPTRHNMPVVIGPKLHAFFGLGMLPGWPVTLQQVAGDGTAGASAVAVDLTVHGEPRRIMVYPVREGGEWRIANISYSNHEDFVSFHRKRSGQ